MEVHVVGAQKKDLAPTVIGEATHYVLVVLHGAHVGGEAALHEGLPLDSLVKLNGRHLTPLCVRPCLLNVLGAEPQLGFAPNHPEGRININVSFCNFRLARDAVAVPPTNAADVEVAALAATEARAGCAAAGHVADVSGHLLLAHGVIVDHLVRLIEALTAKIEITTFCAS